MELINNVNNLDGKNWLRNAINFYDIETFNIEEIQKKFYDLCYKKRTSGETFLYNDKYKISKYDFTFQYVHHYEELKKAFEIIVNSSYNSYHAILVDDEIDDNILISKCITEYIEISGLEYRGKIIVNCKEESTIKKVFLILNRLSDIKSIKLKKHEVMVEKKSEYVISSKSKIDKIGLKHPAPYSYNDIETLIDKEKIHNKVILDPFLGIGSTIIGTYKSNYNIGIELNEEYVELIKERIKFLKIDDLDESKYKIINGDSSKEIKKIEQNIDVVITSPPYFNILKNKSKGVRHDKSQTRQGVEYYSELKNDIGNLDEYDAYLKAMGKIFKESFNKMNKGGKFYLIISDFTINKKETDIHSDMILLMNKAGFVYNGTSYILQNQKAIYPFGYPYKIVLNHIYQYIIIFEKRWKNE